MVEAPPTIPAGDTHSTFVSERSRMVVEAIERDKQGQGVVPRSPGSSASAMNRCLSRVPSPRSIAAAVPA